jgi:hypothetical protein
MECLAFQIAKTIKNQNDHINCRTATMDGNKPTAAQTRNSDCRYRDRPLTRMSLNGVGQLD